jgi:anaerobic magnesium-protoporphyrin IX monomethyl ester cyclase
MYGRSYRTYPIERILADLDDIYFNRKTRLIFITDDNMVLNPKWVMNLCDMSPDAGKCNGSWP